MCTVQNSEVAGDAVCESSLFLSVFGYLDLQSIARHQRTISSTFQWLSIISGPIGVPSKARPHPLTNKYMPTILGHELCGTISAASPDSRFKKGRKVMVDPRLTCHSLSPHGPCVPCTTNRDHQCPKLGFVGYSGSGGGFSEFVAVEEKMLYEIPDSVPLEYAALVEPLTVAHHAIKMTGLKSYADKSVLIVGGGPVGYAVILALRGAGCKRIVVSEPTKRRREEVGKLVEMVVDPRSEDVGERCRELTDGKGMDVCFDCAGVQKGLEAGIDALALGSWWVNVSLWDTPVSALPPASVEVPARRSSDA